MADNVNHPSHYETGRFECIDVMVETQGSEATADFCVCNALKYVYRHKRKNGTEDIKKAVWYLNKYLELMEENNHEVE
jgi:gluconate kinase